MKREGTDRAWRVSAETAAWLAREHGIRQLGELGFENAYALALRSDRARQLGVTSIADLARHAPALALGSDYEFFQRPEWSGVRQAYALEFARLTSFDSTFMYPAVRDGAVDVITAFSSDGRIAAFDLRVLTDPLQAFPPYAAVILLGARAAGEPGVASALEPLLGAIPVALMRAANLRVDREQEPQTPRRAAAWLDAELRSPR
jgi:osmoprotectant transport system permease protein